MKWIMMVVIAFGLLTSCLTVGVPDTRLVTKGFSFDVKTCDGKCDKAREDCMDKLSQFWEQCEADYGMCVEYCY
jgi:hypothetical protein